MRVALPFCLCLIFATSTLLSSCAVFPKSKSDFSLTEENLKTLNGIYAFKPIKTIGKIPYNHSKASNFFQEIDRVQLKRSYPSDTLHHYAFQLEVVSPLQMKISLIQNDTIFETLYLKTQLKSDGFLYLKNQNIKFRLIPYLFGGLNIKKIRFSKSEEELLILEVVEYDSGGAFIILFADWSSAHYSDYYQKLNTKPLRL